MKNILLVLFSIISLSVFGQQNAVNSSAFGHVKSYSVQATVAGVTGSNPYQVTLNAKPNLTGLASMSLANMAVGDLMFSSSNGIYEITAVSGSVATAQLINDPLELGIDVPPSGDVVITRPTGECGVVSSYVADGLLGISFPLQWSIINYNENRTDSCTVALDGGDSPNRFEVTQTAHGFAVLEGVTHTGGLWSQADTTVIANGLVTEVIDANTFVVTKTGYVEIPAHGKTVGDVHYVPDTAGTDNTIRFEGNTQELYQSVTADIISVNVGDRYRNTESAVVTRDATFPNPAFGILHVLLPSGDLYKSDGSIWIQQ